MAVNEDYLTYVLDQLADFEGVESKKMFGGIGLFRSGLMFGMIGGSTFRLKVDKFNQVDFESKGMKSYHSDKKKKGMPYWEVPLDVLEDKTVLKVWAQKAFEAAERTSAKKK